MWRQGGLPPRPPCDGPLSGRSTPTSIPQGGVLHPSLSRPHVDIHSNTPTSSSPHPFSLNTSSSKPPPPPRTPLNPPPGVSTVRSTFTTLPSNIINLFITLRTGPLPPWKRKGGFYHAHGRGLLAGVSLSPLTLRDGAGDIYHRMRNLYATLHPPCGASSPFYPKLIFF